MPQMKNSPTASKNFKWLEAEAAKGNVDAVNTLAICLYHGKIRMSETRIYDLPVNYARAAELFQQAAEAGNMQALHNIAYCYYKGYGVEQDASHALDLFKAAADNGDAEAQKMVDAIEWERRYTANMPTDDA